MYCRWSNTIATISVIKRGWLFDAIAIAVELQEFILGLKAVSRVGIRDQERCFRQNLAVKSSRSHNMYFPWKMYVKRKFPALSHRYRNLRNSIWQWILYQKYTPEAMQRHRWAQSARKPRLFALRLGLGRIKTHIIRHWNPVDLLIFSLLYAF